MLSQTLYDSVLYNRQFRPSSSTFHPLGASTRRSAVGVPATTLAAALLEARNRRETASIRVRASRMVRSARVSRLGAHREAGAVGARSPGWGVEAAVTLVRGSFGLHVVLLRRGTAVAQSGSATGQSSLASLVGFDVGLVGPTHESGTTNEANDHAEDDADDGHGVCALRLAVVNVPGKQMSRAGATVDRSGVGAVDAGARAAVAHDPGRHGHVEAVDCRGHVGRARSGTGVVVAVVNGGEMHFRSVGGWGDAGVGECGKLIDFQTLQIIF